MTSITSRERAYCKKQVAILNFHKTRKLLIKVIRTRLLSDKFVQSRQTYAMLIEKIIEVKLIEKILTIEKLISKNYKY